METDDIKTDYKQIIFLVLIVIFILFMLFTIITLIKNKDIITKDGISYEMTRQNFSYCQCMGEKGLILFNQNK